MAQNTAKVEVVIQDFSKLPKSENEKKELAQAIGQAVVTRIFEIDKSVRDVAPVLDTRGVQVCVGT